MLGFGIMANTLFIIIFSIFSFFITKFIFLKKEENILAEKYGAPYLEYKKIVRI
jgi:protein-S-isoprenylcysteine O-methyltransferase Ste14